MGSGMQTSRDVDEQAVGQDDGLRLRPYQPSDLPMLVAIDAMCFDQNFLFGAAMMQQLAEVTTGSTLIAETGAGETAGFVIAHCDQANVPGAAYLVTIDVLPALRCRGLGGVLLTAVEQVICGGGAQRMDLHVYTENAAAIRFYERHGYVRRSRVRRFYGRSNQDAFLYSKDLTAAANE